MVEGLAWVPRGILAELCTSAKSQKTATEARPAPEPGNYRNNTKCALGSGGSVTQGAILKPKVPEHGTPECWPTMGKPRTSAFSVRSQGGGAILHKEETIPPRTGWGVLGNPNICALLPHALIARALPDGIVLVVFQKNRLCCPGHIHKKGVPPYAYLHLPWRCGAVASYVRSTSAGPPFVLFGGEACRGRFALSWPATAGARSGGRSEAGRGRFPGAARPPG